MAEEHTTVAVQRYLDELAEGASTEPVVRALLERSVRRLEQLCAVMLHRSYPRLTHAPLNLQTDEMLSAVVERLLKAMREVHPETPRQFFALALLTLPHGGPLRCSPTVATPTHGSIMLGKRYPQSLNPQNSSWHPDRVVKNSPLNREFPIKNHNYAG